LCPCRGHQVCLWQEVVALKRHHAPRPLTQEGKTMHCQYRPIAPVLTLLLLFAWPLGSWSATITVGPGQSINDGIRRLNGGDTLIVEDGTYTDKLDVGSIPNGSASAPTVVKAKTLRKAIIQPGGGSGFIADFGSNKQWIVLDGLVFDGSNMSPPAIGVRTKDAHDILLVNLEIRRMRGASSASQSNGMGWDADGRGVIGRNLYVHDIGYDQSPGCCCNECYSYGIYMSGSGYTLENSRFVNISGYAIHGYTSGATGTQNNDLHGNYFENTGAALLMCQSNNKIYNNILNRVGTGGAGGGNRQGIQLAGSCAGQRSENNQVYNNTIYKSEGPCIDLGYTSNATVRNNICWQNGGDSIVRGGSGNTIDHNLLGQDPRFVNAGAGDFHLQPGSPAIDAGVNMGQALVGSAPDIGACEGSNPCGATSGSGSAPPAAGTVPAPSNLRVLTQP
jgi:Right handed beta helix region